MDSLSMFKNDQEVLVTYSSARNSSHTMQAATEWAWTISTLFLPRERPARSNNSSRTMHAWLNYAQFIWITIVITCNMYKHAENKVLPEVAFHVLAKAIFYLYWCVFILERISQTDALLHLCWQHAERQRNTDTVRLSRRMCHTHWQSFLHLRWPFGGSYLRDGTVSLGGEIARCLSQWEWHIRHHTAEVNESDSALFPPRPQPLKRLYTASVAKRKIGLTKARG